MSIPVAYDIVANGTVLRADTLNIYGGDRRELSTWWTAVPGRIYLYAGISNGAMEPVSERGNNTRGYYFNVPYEQATQILDFEKARLAGAQFDRGEENVIGCTKWGYFAPHSGLSQSVQFWLVGLPPCGRISPSAFGNFTLKNGWHVTNFELLPTSSQGVVQILAKPDSGATRPFVRLRIEHSGDISKPMSLVAPVRITMRGPKALSPY